MVYVWGWEVFGYNFSMMLCFSAAPGNGVHPLCRLSPGAAGGGRGGVVGWEPHSGRVAKISVFVCQVIGVLVPVSFTSR